MAMTGAERQAKYMAKLRANADIIKAAAKESGLTEEEIVKEMLRIQRLIRRQ